MSDGWWEAGACLFCGSDAIEPWLHGISDHLRFVRGEWALLRCRDCGSTHISPMPRQETIAQLYPKVYGFRPDFETDSRTKSAIARAEELLFYRALYHNEPGIIEHVAGLSRGNMLDVGCGTGARLARFANAGFEVRGLEIQPELVSYVQETLGFAADTGTLDSIAYPDNSFDLVSIYYVIEHLIDVHSVLRKIHAMLRPGGWVMIGIPFADSNQSQLLKTRWSQFREAPRHVNVPSQEGIRKALDACGFDRYRMIPTTALSCASAFAQSIIPASTANHAYTGSGMLRHLPRLAGGVLTLLYTPVAAYENRVMKRPALAIVLARKPA